jgi:hypothetical protein
MVLSARFSNKSGERRFGADEMNMGAPDLSRDARQLLFAAGLACVAAMRMRAQTQQQASTGSTGGLDSGDNAPAKSKKIPAPAAPSPFQE